MSNVCALCVPLVFMYMFPFHLVKIVKSTGLDQTNENIIHPKCLEL